MGIEYEAWCNIKSKAIINEGDFFFFFSGKSDKSTSFYFKKLIVASIEPTTIGAVCGKGSFSK